jgi:hypothetical protein
MRFSTSRRRPRTEALNYEGPQRPAVAWTETDGLYVSALTDGSFQPKVRVAPINPSSKRTARDYLERRSLALKDLDGDGKPDLIWTRTAATGGAIPELKTELLIFRNKGEPSTKPDQVLLLPGVLSDGPSVADVNGDGRPDLFLSIYGGGIGSELARRLTGRVSLDLLLYLGQPDGTMFARSPQLKLNDSVPIREFEYWGLRHRLLITHDWNGDGVHDLAQIESVDGGLILSVFLGQWKDSSFSFMERAFAVGEYKGDPKRFRAMNLHSATVCLLITTDVGVVHLLP